MSVQTLLALAAAVPGIAVLVAMGVNLGSVGSIAGAMLIEAPLVTVTFLVTYALLVAALMRAVAPLLAPGTHADDGSLAWAYWFSEGLMESTRGLLFPLYASLYVRPWLRLAGIRVGRRTEVSTAVGLNPLVTIGQTSFLTDDVVLATARARGGWISVEPITIGDRTFIGPGAVLCSGTQLGDDCLVGALSTPPQCAQDGTSWLGVPALQLPRVPDRPDPTRTTAPPRRLIAARGAIELVRLLLPGTVSVLLGTAVFLGFEALGHAGGVAAMVLGAPALLLVAGIIAATFTVVAKWLVMGRYRTLERPLWSFFIWRDEVINTCQEQLARAWLLEPALATPLMSAYLRAMGAKVGRNVWLETLAVTEFDLVHLDDGAVLNRGACLMTHLVHDRLMRTGPTTIGAAATLGPASAVLPDTRLGAACTVGGRSIVLRGEELPAATRWHGAPVVPQMAPVPGPVRQPVAETVRSRSGATAAPPLPA
jgi:non-ribosomal peptide synthetase-like protein